MRVFRVLLVLLFRRGLRSSLGWRAVTRLCMLIAANRLYVLVTMTWLYVLVAVPRLYVLVTMTRLQVLVTMTRLQVLVAVSRQCVLVTVPWLHAPVIMPWGFMAMGIFSEAIIADGVFAPITMLSFPAVKPLQPHWITDQPNAAGSQIKIPIANHPHVFAINDDVTFRHHDRLLDHYWRRRLIDRRRHHHLGRHQHYAPIGINHAARHDR